MLKSLLRNCLQTARQTRIRLAGGKVGRRCQIGAGVQVHLGSGPKLGCVVMGDEALIERGVVFRAWGGSIVLGPNVFVGEYTVVYGHGGVTVGDNTLIAMHCRIVSSNHTIPGRGSCIRHHPDILLPTAIGRDVWLGAGVTILGGVTVGDGCVVAAGSVVTRDLPAYAIAMGVPARVIRFRE